MRPAGPAGVPDRQGSGAQLQPAMIADIALQRRALLAEVTRLASGVGAAIREARAVNLPTVPGISEAREALVAWAHLMHELLAPPAGPDA
jgi:hypothetical protein